MRHPAPGSLHLLLDSLSVGELKHLEHLLACRVCRKAARSALGSRLTGRPGRKGGGRASQPDYEPAFAKAREHAEAATRRVAAERALAGGLATELDRLAPAARRERAATDSTFANLPLGLLFVGRARSAELEDIDAFFDATEISLAIADGLEGFSQGEAAQTLRAETWLAMGRRERLAGDFGAALEALREAGEWLPAPLGAPERAALLAELARTYRDAGCEDEAAALFRRSIESYEEAEEHTLLAEVLAETGSFLAFAGDPEGAGLVLEEAFALWGTPPSPAQAVAAWAAWAVAERARGAVLPAEAALGRAKVAFSRLTGRERIRLAWPFAAATVEVGAPDVAERALCEILDSPAARPRERLCAALHLGGIAARARSVGRVREALARIPDLGSAAGLCPAEESLLRPFAQPGSEGFASAEALRGVARLLQENHRHDLIYRPPTR